MKETLKPFKHGQVTIGAAVTQVIDPVYKFYKGILLRAAGDNDPVPNTAVIWIGGPSVTSDDGMPLAPGETITIPLEDGTRLHAVSTASGQKLAWMGM